MVDKGRLIAGEVLGTIRTELAQRIIPQLSDADALHSARMMDGLLAHLSAWLLLGPDLVETANRAFSSLSAPAESPKLLEDFLFLGGGLSATREALQQELEQGAPRPIKPIIDADATMLDTETTMIKTAADGVAGRLAASEVVVTPDLATRFVEATLGTGHRVDVVDRAPGGFSKDTMFFAAVAPDGQPLPLVIRRDLPYGPGETTVVDEYRLLEGLAAAGFPIAAPLALDMDLTLGQPAMISARVAGQSGSDDWAHDPQLRDAICVDLARVLARLHRLDPENLGLGGQGRDPRDVVRDYVVEWRDRWRRNRLHPSPSLAAGYEWLLANIPATIARVSIVHGDIGFHNTLVDQGQLTALLDWEFAHLGDAAEDLSYCRPFIEAIGGWDAFIAAYREAGGAEYKEENAAYFNVWRSVRNATSCATAWHGFTTGRYPALKMAFQGIPLYRRFIREVIAALDARV